MPSPRKKSCSILNVGGERQIGAEVKSIAYVVKIISDIEKIDVFPHSHNIEIWVNSWNMSNRLISICQSIFFLW